MNTINLGLRITTDPSAAVRGVGSVEGALGGLKKTIVDMAGTVAAALSLKELFNVANETEKLRASLQTVTGSAESARGAFAALEGFASSTPYALDQSVEAFIRMKSLGLAPTEAALTSFGNTAAAMGKDLLHFVDAVADATTGEFEQLKSFGIKASAEGANVAFTFQGVTKTVGNNAQEITAYLEEIGNVNFAGAMEAQMERLPGIVSNLQDNLSGLLRSIADAGATDIMASGMSTLSDSIKDVSDAISTGFVFDALTTEVQVWIETTSGSFSAFYDMVSEAGNWVGEFMDKFYGFQVTAEEMISVQEDGANRLFIAYGHLFDFLGDAFVNFPQNAQAAFTIIIGEADQFVIRMEAGWATMARGAQVAWETIKLSAAQALDWIVRQFGERLSGMVSLAEMVPGAEQLTSGLRSATDALANFKGAEDGVRAGMAQTASAFQGVIAGYKARTEASKSAIDSAMQERDASIANANQQRALAKEFSQAQIEERKLRAGLDAFAGSGIKAAAAADKLAGSTKKAKDESKQMADEAKKMADEIENLLRKYIGGYREAAEYKDAQADLGMLYAKNKISLEQYTDALGDYLNKQDGMDGAMQNTRKLKAEADPYAEAWVHAIERVDDAFADVWKGAFTSFKGFASSLKDAFLQLLGELAHQAITRPIMVSLGLGASATGTAQAGQSALGNVGGVGGITDMLGLGSIGSAISTAVGGALSGIGGSLVSMAGGTGFLGGAGAGLASVGGAGMSGMGGAISSGLGMIGSGQTSMGIGAIVGATAPLAAAAVLALPIVNNLMRKSETTSVALKGTVSSAGLDGRWQSTNTKSGGLWGNGDKVTGRDLYADEQASINRQISTVYDAMAGLGKAVGLGVDAIYDYTAELSAETLKDGQAGIDAALADFGRQLIGQYTKVFADVGTGMGRVFSQMDINADNINAVLAAYATLNAYLTDSPIDQFSESLALANRSAWEVGESLQNAISLQLDYYDGSLAATQALASATAERYQHEMQMLQQINSISEGIAASYGNAIEQIQMELMDTPERYDYLKAQAESLSDQLSTMIDPAKIAETAAQIERLTMSAYGLLSDDQKKDGMGQETVDYLTQVEQIAQERLDAAQTRVMDTHQQIATSIEEKMERVAARQEEAAQAMMQAVAALEAAASRLQEPQQIEINVGVDGNIVGEVGYA